VIEGTSNQHEARDKAMATGPTLPGDHPDRMALNNEVHARPPEALSERMRISYLVLFGELDMEPLRDLCGRYGVEVPGASANHFSADLGPFRLKWERHTEFTRFWFLVPASGTGQLFEKTALEAVPDGWLKSLKGEVLVANHVELLPAPRGKLDEESCRRSILPAIRWLVRRCRAGQGVRLPTSASMPTGSGACWCSIPP
jgi:uncharacterized membrane-anchored protein